MELIAVTVGGISMYTYGMIASGAILAGMLTAWGSFLLHGEDPWRVEDLLLWGLPLSLLAGRAVYVLCNWSEFTSSPLMMLCFWHGGISPCGVALAVLFTVFSYCQVHGFDPWRWMDLLVPAFFLASALQDFGLAFLPQGTGMPSPAEASGFRSLMEYVDFQFYPLDFREMRHAHAASLWRAQLELLAFLLAFLSLFWQKQRRTPWKSGSILFLGAGSTLLIQIFFVFF